MLLLFFLLFFFHAFLLRMSVRSVLWILKPVTGLTIKAEKMEVSWGRPIHGHRVTVSTGKAPFATQLTFEDASIELSSCWRLFFGDHLLITSLQATNGKGIIDLRTTATTAAPFWKKKLSSLASSLSEELDLLPSSVQFHDVSFLLLSEGERYTIDCLSCTLPNKLSGQLSYESILIEAGTVHCRLAAGKAKALWDGKKLSLHQLSLADEVMLRDLTIIPHRDRMELGIVAEAFDGLLRADGSLHHTPEGTFIDSALLGQQLPLGRLSRFLGLQKNLAGTIREGRLTFRGLMSHLMDAEASLRMLADNVRLEKRGWASLAVTAHLIGRKISLADFQLKQHENRVAASGEITLPEEWHKIAQAPFLLKLKANISEASQLADLIGTSWNNMTGKLFADGEIHGAANHAEGYFNLQGTAMTVDSLPLNSLKLQLLFQGEKTNLTNLDIWSGSDRLQCSGIVENKWPHHYEGRATIQSSDLSEKLIPLLQQCHAEIPASCVELFPLSFFEKPTLQGGSLQASWEGHGEASQHEGSFHVTLNDLFQGLHKVSSHSEGSYGPEWISFPALVWENGSKKYSTQLTLSSRGIDLQKFSLTEDHVTTLSGNAFLPLDATMLSHQPFSLSQALLRDLPLAVHLQCHHLMIEHDLKKIPLPILPSFLDGSLDADGLLEKLSLHLSLIGRDSAAERSNPKMKFNLSAEQGEGIIDLSLATTKNKILTLQGKLPVGLIVQKESAPLQEQERWQLGPPSAPLDLKLSIPPLTLDEAAARYLTSFFHVEKSLLSGNLTCKGTLGQPEPAGELQFQAGSVSMEGNITPLHHLQARFLFNKDKMELNDALAWIGKEKVTVSGTTEWHHQKQEYHFLGTHLPLYQSATASATGDLNLMLQGENQEGVLRGTVLLQEIQGPSSIAVTPFLVPPGINLESPPIAPPKTLPPWTLDVSIIAPPSNRPCETVNLHLMSDLFSPTIEGSIALQHLPVIFPRTTMTLLQGSCNFDASEPWQPTLQITANGTLHSQKVTASLSPDHTLQLQSDPFVAPTTLALELALSKESSSQDEETWLSQLPYWDREQSLMEPTTLFQSFAPNSNHENREDLGFGGCGISYRAEIK